MLSVMNDERGLGEGRMKDCDRNSRKMHGWLEYLVVTNAAYDDWFEQHCNKRESFGERCLQHIGC